VDESRGAEGRHRGLRTTIDWSVQLLTEEQRRFFARLAVFPASFDVAAAAAVTGYNQGRAIRLLAAVVRNSLVRPTGEDRFVLLDSLHDYAADLLDEDPDQADVAARHASFYAERAREAERHVRSPDQQVWWARLREDLANFRAAMQWSFSYGDGRLGAPMAASLTWVFIHDGMLDEADRWLRHAAKVDGLDASTGRRS
jgi:non-specific serine/threonine protein kinase